MCGIKNAHIGSISTQWNEDPQKPRILKIKEILKETETEIPVSPHIEVEFNGHTHHYFTVKICEAILEYYAYEAGAHRKDEARKNFRLLAGNSLQDMIYKKVSYQVNNEDKLKSWLERISLNHQSAPNGFFSIFNDLSPFIYKLIELNIMHVNKHNIPDISVGMHWSKYWEENKLSEKYGERCKYPHRYPKSHPQYYSNPQESWCYPLDALGNFREWLDSIYIKEGKFLNYAKGKIRNKLLPKDTVEKIEILSKDPYKK